MSDYPPTKYARHRPNQNRNKFENILCVLLLLMLPGCASLSKSNLMDLVSELNTPGEEPTGAIEDADTRHGITAPIWTIGSQWSYSDGYAIEVADVDGDITTFDRVDAPGQWMSRRGFLREQSESSTTKRRVIYRSIPPETGLLLEPTKALTFQREFMSGPHTHVHATSWRVEGQEQISVPAGTFDCWVIVWRTRNLTTNWTGFERWWFSPLVGNYVRMEYQYGDSSVRSRVLMDFDLAS